MRPAWAVAVALAFAGPGLAFIGGEELVLRPTPLPLRQDLAYGRFGAGDLYFFGPVDIATDEENRAYILDSGNHRIQVANEKGDFVAKWEFGSRPDTLDDQPAALALDRKRKALYLLDRKRGKVQRFGLDGGLTATFGVQGLRKGTLDDPVDLPVDGYGMVYVLDRGRKKVLQFTPDGTFRREFGERGQARDGLSDPVSLACTEETIGYVVVLDAGGPSLVRFDRDGLFRDRTPIPSEVLGGARPSRLRVDRDDGLFILAVKERNLVKFSRSIFSSFSLGEEGSPLKGASGLAIDGKGRIYVTDMEKHRVNRFILEPP